DIDHDTVTRDGGHDALDDITPSGPTRPYGCLSHEVSHALLLGLTVGLSHEGSHILLFSGRLGVSTFGLRSLSLGDRGLSNLSFANFFLSRLIPSFREHRLGS